MMLRAKTNEERMYLPQGDGQYTEEGELDPRISRRRF